jgi:hypothetical protein
MTEATSEVVNRPDYPLLMIRAEIASGKATVRSLGALYMVAMASRHSRGEICEFADINRAIMNFRKPDGTDVERAMSLEPVKKVAWNLYDAMIAALASQEQEK